MKCYKLNDTFLFFHIHKSIVVIRLFFYRFLFALIIKHVMIRVIGQVLGEIEQQILLRAETKCTSYLMGIKCVCSWWMRSKYILNRDHELDGMDAGKKCINQWKMHRWGWKDLHTDNHQQPDTREYKSTIKCWFTVTSSRLFYCGYPHNSSQLFDLQYVCIVHHQHPHKTGRQMYSYVGFFFGIVFPSFMHSFSLCHYIKQFWSSISDHFDKWGRTAKVMMEMVKRH